MATAQISARDVFSYLRPEQIDKIHDSSQLVTFRAGEIIYTQAEKGRHLYVLLEGQVELRVPGNKGVSIPIETAGRGAILGAGASFDLHAYTVTAQCVGDCTLLKIDAALLRKMMEEDCRMGYALQKRIADVYFKRYTEAMQKLQAIVMSIPLEPQ